MFGVKAKAASYTFTAALVLIVMYALFAIRGTLFVLTLSVLFAYLLQPLVSLLNRYLPSRSRTPALAIVYLMLIGGLVWLGVTVGSEVADEASSLSERAPQLIEKMKQSPSTSTPSKVQSLKESALTGIQTYVYQHYREMASLLPSLSLKLLHASSNLIFLIIVPIMSFFILKDGTQMKEEFLCLIEPGPTRELVDALMDDIHKLLLQYMRALFTLCTVTLITFAVVLGLMGVPYALLLATVAFPLEFIPLVGPLVAAVIIISVTVFSGYSHWVLVIAFLGIYRLIQDYVISPRLMSAGVELHPLLVIVGVFAGGEIGGVAGTFLSVPTIALLRVVYRRIRTAQTERLHPVIQSA